MAGASLLHLSRFGLTDRGNLHTWCWCSYVDVLGEEGNYCVKFFSYLSGCTLTVVTTVDNLSHSMPLNRYQTFDSRSRPWHPYSIRFPRIIWYLTCQVTYFPSSMPSSLNHTWMSVALTWLLMLSHWHDLGLTTWNVWHKMSLCHPSWMYAVWCMGKDKYLYRSGPRCHRHSCWLSHTLPYASWLTEYYATKKACSFLRVGTTYWQSSCCQEAYFW